MSKKVASLLLASLFVLTVFGGVVSAAGEVRPQISSHSKSFTVGGEHAPRSLQSQHEKWDKIAFVNGPFNIFELFWSHDPAYFSNKPAVLYRLNPATSQWEHIQVKYTTAAGRVEFYGLKEDKPGIYDYIVSCRGNHPPNSAKILITYPVILVHGWHESAEETWSSQNVNMERELDSAGFVKGIHYFVFTYDGFGDPRTAADGLQNFIKEKKVFFHDQYQYDDSKFTIVCHSMGALVTRWYMEREGRAENVTQWGGIAPTSHGAALADLAPDLLFSIFNPFIGKRAVQQLKTDSETVRGLDDPNSGATGRAHGVIYRVIVGDNRSNDTQFGSLSLLWAGRTLAKATNPAGNGGYYFTSLGDGVVANEQSRIDGDDFHAFTGCDHNAILHDSKVLKYVLDFIENPYREIYNPDSP
ncbi:MAG: alpha/beta fold hydrolase [Halobacteriota archaeon]